MSVSSRAECIHRSGDPTLYSRDDARAQFSRRNDRVNRSHLAGPLDVVYSFKLRCHLAELVRTYCRAGGGELYPQAGTRRVVRASGKLRFELANGRVCCGTPVHVSWEYHRCRGCTADNRGERSLDSEHFHVVVERVGEHHESPAVIARDHAEHDRSVEVDDGWAAFGAGRR